MLCEDTYILPDNTASTVNSVQVAKIFFLSLVALRVGWRSFLYLEVLRVFFQPRQNFILLELILRVISICMVKFYILSCCWFNHVKTSYLSSYIQQYILVYLTFKKKHFKAEFIIKRFCVN